MCFDIGQKQSRLNILADFQTVPHLCICPLKTSPLLPPPACGGKPAPLPVPEPA